jgi:type IV pilus assembly protein PilW
MRGREVHYYINDDSLFRWDDDNGAQELVAGVTNMHIEYGLDTTDEDGDGVDVYKIANAVESDGDWDKVVAVRISLLVRGGEGQVTDERQTYTFPSGVEKTADDKRLYQVFTKTIALRNRMP